MAPDTPTLPVQTPYSIDRGHAFGEAFMLMNYRCQSCGHRELIWNSRDGITPFSCACPACDGGHMMHEHWTQDRYAPHHRLKKGERYWRDGTVDEAAAIMQRRFDQMRATYPLPPEDEQALLDKVRNGDSTEFPAGWPKLATHGERPCVRCGTLHQHNNSYCSGQCCKAAKLDRRNGSTQV